MQPIRILIISLCFFAGLPVKAQEFHIERNPVEIVKHTHWGPNRAHFGHFFMGIGVSTPLDQGMEKDISIPLSENYRFGYRYRIKIINGLLVGAEANVNSTTYQFKRGEGIPPFGPELLARERATLGNGEGGLFLRLRFGQRGDYIGRYIDLGIGTQLNISSRYLVKKRDLLSSTAREAKIIYSDLELFSPWVHQMTMRIGMDRLSVFGKYRWTRLLRPVVAGVDLPRLIIGMEISTVSY